MRDPYRNRSNPEPASNCRNFRSDTREESFPAPRQPFLTNLPRMHAPQCRSSYDPGVSNDEGEHLTFATCRYMICFRHGVCNCVGSGKSNKAICCTWQMIYRKDDFIFHLPLTNKIVCPTHISQQIYSESTTISQKILSAA